MIGIIDYERGNIHSVYKAFVHVGLEATILKSPACMDKVDKLVLPGVGAFGDGMTQLNKLGFTNPLIEKVRSGIPFLGICLGLQLLFDTSEENPEVQGLSLIKGNVKKFKGNFKIPHMGWNQIKLQKNTFNLETNLSHTPFCYFVHSYIVHPEKKEDILFKTDYYGEFVSGIQKDNIWGFQFHPEKSQEEGLKLLQIWGNQC